MLTALTRGRGDPDPICSLARALLLLVKLEQG